MAFSIFNLNNTYRSRFVRNGYVLLQNYFSKDEAKHIVKCANELQEYPEVLDKWMIYFEKDKNKVVDKVTNLCKTFDDRVIVDYAGVVRWPVGTFMKPHVDDNNVHRPDVFAAMLYLNDDFKGGSTVFEDIEVKPEKGKLVIFSNSQHLHYVSKVEEAERFVLSFWYSRP